MFICVYKLKGCDAVQSEFNIWYKHVIFVDAIISFGCAKPPTATLESQYSFMLTSAFGTQEVDVALHFVKAITSTNIHVHLICFLHRTFSISQIHLLRQLTKKFPSTMHGIIRLNTGYAFENRENQL